MPMLTPTTFFCSIMMVIYCFKIYDVVAIMTQGGPGRSTKMLVTYIFELSFGGEGIATSAQYGVASAVSMVLLVIVLLVTFVQFRGEKNGSIICKSGGAAMTTIELQKPGRQRVSAPRVAITVLKWALLLFLTVMALIPFVWMVSASLKTSVDVFSIPMKWIPETLHWENFVSIWERVPLLAYFKNTGILAVIVTFMQILTSSFAAYAFAKMSFKGRDILFMCYIGTIAVPWQVYMVPQFIMMRALGLYDTIWALVVLQSFSAFGVFLMRQFYLGIPNELS